MPKVLNRSVTRWSTSQRKFIHVDDIPDDAVYVGRPTKWGNPYVIGENAETREEAVEMYKKWISTEGDLLADLHELKGKDLVCWCAPKLCHADVLLKLAND